MGEGFAKTSTAVEKCLCKGQAPTSHSFNMCRRDTCLSIFTGSVTFKYDFLLGLAWWYIPVISAIQEV
jgi:hypothetical protein